MTKRILAIMFFGFFVFVSNVFAYPQCDSSLTVPCSYPGIGFDFNVVYADGYGDYYFANSNHVQFVNYNNTHYTAATVPWGYGYSVQNDLGFEGLAFYNHSMFCRVSSNGFQWIYSPPENYYNYAAFPSLFTLTVSRSPEAGGGAASNDDEIQCGYNSNNYCQVDYSINSEVELTAYLNTGYAFAYWDDGTNQYTDNPHTFTMSGNMGVGAVFLPVLQFPLSGTLESRIKEHFVWGDTWTPGECPTGTYEKHVGIDLDATTTDDVYAAHAGVVKEIYTGQHAQWADALIIESADGQFTTVYWHIITYGNLAVNDTVTKGQHVADVADLGDNTHFHLGIRMAPFVSGISDKGALPIANCGNPVKPAFPEHFIDPTTVTFE